MKPRSLSFVSSATKTVALLLAVALPVASQGTAPLAAESPGSAPAPARPTNTWGGCVDPIDGYAPVTIGEPTTVCLVLASGANWATEVDYMRLNFQPVADAYSRFHVPESFVQLVGNPNSDLTELFPQNITVHAASQTALSFQKLYYGGEDKVYPALTAVITVNEGNVTGITWDNGCVFCADTECEDNTYGYDGGLQTAEEAEQPVGSCPIPVEECKASEKAECDLLLYVVWTGTDSKGRDFTSSANRFSAFPKQSWSDRINLGLPDWMDNLNPFGGDETSN